MTRATVGGINSEDNLWYPLAVNSQGIAQIDTSGIPQPMEWEYGTFEPYYTSSDEQGSAIIEYNKQGGWYAKLGNMVFVKVFLRTSSVVFTNPRGSLAITGFPFTWVLNDSMATYAGSSISQMSLFANECRFLYMHPTGRNLVFGPQKLVGDTTTRADFTDLAEHNESTRNDLRFSHWGLIASTDDPPDLRFVNGILQETDEIPTDTP